VLDLDPHAARLHMRIGKHLREIVDRARGDAGLFQLFQPVGHGLLQEEAGEDRHDFLAVDDAVVVLEEARIGRQLGGAEHAAGALELAVIADHQHQLAVGAAEHAGRHAAIAPGAAPRRGLAVDKEDLRVVRQRGDHGVEQADVDVLPLPAIGLAVIERGQNADR
jgi:hypothetical protein